MYYLACSADFRVILFPATKPRQHGFPRICTVCARVKTEPIVTVGMPVYSGADDGGDDDEVVSPGDDSAEAALNDDTAVVDADDDSSGVGAPVGDNLDDDGTPDAEDGSPAGEDADGSGAGTRFSEGHAFCATVAVALAVAGNCLC